tara:strand:+ start:170 stop:829 length:660 start_codon:yes stop_codon:yes gene_type:complete
MKDYFISDTHFGHKNVIRYCNRPFKTVTEMNETIVSRWNNIVSDGDRVFVIGDVFLMSPLDAKPIIESLNGYKILIAGNHDRSKKTMLAAGFDEYHKSYDYSTNKFEKVLLNHYPVPDIILRDGGYAFQIHGHIHSPPIVRGLKINVAVDLIDFKPIDIDHILQLRGCISDTSKDELFEAKVNDGRLLINMNIATEDFSGASSRIYDIIREQCLENTRK